MTDVYVIASNLRPWSVKKAAEYPHQPHYMAKGGWTADDESESIVRFSDHQSAEIKCDAIADLRRRNPEHNSALDRPYVTVLP